MTEGNLARRPVLLVYLSAGFVTLSELTLKIGVNQSAGSSQFLFWLKSPWVWAGILAGLVSMVGWLAALRRLPLSVAFIHSNVVHVLVPICCWLFLDETITGQRWLGIACVIAGITCIAKPLAHIEESR